MLNHLSHRISWCAGGSITQDLSARMDAHVLPHLAQGQQDAMEQRFRARRAAGDIDVDGNDCIYSAERCIVCPKDASADAAGTHGNDNFRGWRRGQGLAQCQFHVASHRTGDQQHVGMTRRGGQPGI